MRRAALVLGTTVAGLAALFSYKTHVAGIAVASTSPATPAVSTPPMTPSTSPSPSKTAPKKKRVTAAPTKSAPTYAPPPPTPTKTSAPPKPSGTFTGPVENTQYGAVQVQITVSNGKITNANGSLPQGGSQIGQNALPQLNQEVLTAQSANIQAVSGATYTSNGYIGSLQQAVNKAGL
jgi:uncharacterized protein with FMN-binding domain